MEAEIQLGNRNVYKDIDFQGKILQELADTSNNLFRNLKKNGCISEKELRYFRIEFKKATNLSKLYLLPKIDKRLFDVPGRLNISNCGTPTEKVSEFLCHMSKPVMQQCRCYIKDASDFMNKLKEIKDVPKDAIMFTADVICLYPSIPHDVGLEALRTTLDDLVNKIIDDEDLIKMAEFVLKNNYFEFNGKVKQQLYSLWY